MTAARLTPRQWGMRVLVAILLAYSAVHVVYSACRYFGQSDFDVMLRYTKTFVETGVYPDYGRYTYPPFYFVLMLPFASVNPEVMRFGAYAVFAGLLVWSIIACTRLFAGGPVRGTQWLLIGILCANYQPLLEAISAHSIESLEVWLVIMALAAFLKGRKALCGALIMAAANLKFFPGVFLVYFLYKREWRVVGGAALGLGAVVLAIALAFGPAVVSAHLFGTPMRLLGLETENLGETHRGVWDTDNMLNLSLRGAVNRWFADETELPQVGWGYYPIHQPGNAQAVTLGLQGVLFGWLAVLLRRRLRSREQVIIESLLVLTSIFFVTPASVAYYAVFLLPAVVWFALSLSGGVRQPLPVLLCCGGWYALIGNFVPLGVLHYLPAFSPYMHNVYWYWWRGFPLLGDVLLLIGLSLALRGELRRRQRDRVLDGVGAERFETLMRAPEPAQVS